MIRKVVAGGELLRAAGTVTKKLRCAELHREPNQKRLETGSEPSVLSLLRAPGDIASSQCLERVTHAAGSREERVPGEVEVLWALRGQYLE